MVLRLQDMGFVDEFYVIWASAFLLHVPSEEKRIVFQKMVQALKPKGITFDRYQYGHSIMETLGRIFYNMTEKMEEKEIAGFFNFKIIEMWTAQDTFARNPSPEHKWLYFIAQKI